MATLSDLSFPHFHGNLLWRFPWKWGRVASGGLVAASCVPDRDEENVQLVSPRFCVVVGGFWTVAGSLRYVARASSAASQRRYKFLV